MTIRLRLIAICLGVAACAAYVAAITNSPASHVQQSAISSGKEELPQLGTRLTPLPEGAGKAAAEAACLSCHSADLIRQQRLTKQQWTGTLTKMINWGVVVPDDQREVLLEYLVTHFGPENASFQPVVARPAGR